jgi:hypothetical protein
MVAAAEATRAGNFQVAAHFPVEALGFPPRWRASGKDDNWFSCLHSLQWLIPLVHAHASDPDAGYLEAAYAVALDWIAHNPFRGAPSRFSWHDHAAAKRLRLFAWLWEQYRLSGASRPASSDQFLASVYQHARHHMDARNYRPNSNHGLEAIGALWAATVTFPFFREATEWADAARQRVRQWVRDNLSPEGFHLEQSPAYHWFVLIRLALIDRFLCANGCPDAALTEATERAARVWPHLLQPNGAIPGVGDSSRNAPADWRKYLAHRWGRPVPPSAEPAAAPERNTFVVSPGAGYAVSRASPSPEADAAADTYVLFRCRAFLSPHCHHDALSFTFFGAGRDWLIDPGYLTYHEWDPRRQYVRSPRAHSTAIVGHGDYRTGHSECVEWGPGEEGDFAVGRHDLPGVRHTRYLTLASSSNAILRDELTPLRRGLPRWQQLFQVARDLEVDVVSDREAHLIAPDGARCTITQSVSGDWRLARGETKPRLQGWYSESYGRWEPGCTLFFTPSSGTRVLQTTLTLCPAQSRSDQLA